MNIVQEQVEKLNEIAMSSSIQQLFSLEGKTALVTGGTRGLGEAMAIAMAEAGADILLVQVGYGRTKAPYRTTDRCSEERREQPIHKESCPSVRTEITNLRRGPGIP